MMSVDKGKADLALGEDETIQPDGQITEIVSSPAHKNIPLSPSGKSGVCREPADFQEAA